MSNFGKRVAMGAALVGAGALGGLPATLIALATRPGPSVSVSQPAEKQPAPPPANPNVTINGTEYELRLVTE